MILCSASACPVRSVGGRVGELTMARGTSSLTPPEHPSYYAWDWPNNSSFNRLSGTWGILLTQWFLLPEEAFKNSSRSRHFISRKSCSNFLWWSLMPRFSLKSTLTGNVRRGTEWSCHMFLSFRSTVTLCPLDSLHSWALLSQLAVVSFSLLARFSE
jgi:hypothetical protein